MGRHQHGKWIFRVQRHLDTNCQAQDQAVEGPTRGRPPPTTRGATSFTYRFNVDERKKTCAENSTIPAIFCNTLRWRRLCLLTKADAWFTAFASMTFSPAKMGDLRLPSRATRSSPLVTAESLIGSGLHLRRSARLFLEQTVRLPQLRTTSSRFGGASFRLAESGRLMYP